MNATCTCGPAMAAGWACAMCPIHGGHSHHHEAVAIGRAGAGGKGGRGGTATTLGEEGLSGVGVNGGTGGAYRRGSTDETFWPLASVAGHKLYEQGFKAGTQGALDMFAGIIRAAYQTADSWANSGQGVVEFADVVGDGTLGDRLDDLADHVNTVRTGVDMPCGVLPDARHAKTLDDIQELAASGKINLGTALARAFALGTHAQVKSGAALPTWLLLTEVFHAAKAVVKSYESGYIQTADEPACEDPSPAADRAYGALRVLAAAVAKVRP